MIKLHEKTGSIELKENTGSIKLHEKTGNIKVVEYKSRTPATEGLIAYYPFDGDVKDYAGDNDGTIIGDPEFVEGVSEQALELDGNGDYAVLGDFGGTPVSDPSISGSLTISIWVYPENGDYIISSGGQTTSRGFAIIYGQSVDFYLCDGQKRWQINAPALAQNIWTHITVTWDGAIFSCYYNANKVAQDANPTDQQNNDRYKNLTLGTPNNRIGDYLFSGSIDELRIYNRALTEYETKIIYEQKA